MFVVVSISLLFSFVLLLGDLPVQQSSIVFLLFMVVQLPSCHFWVHWAIKLEVQAILEHYKVSNGFLGKFPCCYWLLGAYPTFFALFWAWNSILTLCGPICHNYSNFLV